MYKKIISLMVAVGVVYMGVFSVTNAFALSFGAPINKIPLTSALKLCTESAAEYLDKIESIRASAISLQWSKDQLYTRLRFVKDYWVQVCDEAGIDYTKMPLR